MAKKQKTLVTLVLDETGSMSSVQQATVSGVNEYIQSLKSQPGETRLTLITFNSARIRTVHNATPIADVGEFRDYLPNNTTPLYDAIGTAIRDIEQALAGMKGKSSVLVMIMTDGEENSSKEFNRERIFNLIKQKEADGWTFGYMGANQDAWQVGASIGVPNGNSTMYAAADPGGGLKHLSHATQRYMRAGGQSLKGLFEDDDNQ